MRRLRLTSPFLHGDDVKELQRELRKDGYLKGGVDGVYGPVTAQAAFRAKYWLGYRVPDQSASDLLVSYLKGTKKPDAKMRARVAQRKKAKPRTPLREKALKRLSNEVGYKESPPGSNRNKFGKWYGMDGVPWCACAVTWAYVGSGSKAFKKGQRFAYVPFIVNQAHRGEGGFALTSAPQPGDICCYAWDGPHDTIADHVGLFKRWLDKGHTSFEAVEANTSVGNDSNGGEVMLRQRQRSQVQAFVHCAR